MQHGIWLAKITPNKLQITCRFAWFHRVQVTTLSCLSSNTKQWRSSKNLEHSPHFVNVCNISIFFCTPEAAFVIKSSHSPIIGWSKVSEVSVTILSGFGERCSVSFLMPCLPWWLQDLCMSGALRIDTMQFPWWVLLLENKPPPNLRPAIQCKRDYDVQCRRWKAGNCFKEDNSQLTLNGVVLCSIKFRSTKQNLVKFFTL